MSCCNEKEMDMLYMAQYICHIIPKKIRKVETAKNEFKRILDPKYKSGPDKWKFDLLAQQLICH